MLLFRCGFCVFLVCLRCILAWLPCIAAHPYNVKQTLFHPRPTEDKAFIALRTLTVSVYTEATLVSLTFRTSLVSVLVKKWLDGLRQGPHWCLCSPDLHTFHTKWYLVAFKNDQMALIFVVLLFTSVERLSIFCIWLFWSDIFDSRKWQFSDSWTYGFHAKSHELLPEKQQL